MVAEALKRYVKFSLLSDHRNSHDEHPDRDNLCNANDVNWKKYFSRCFLLSDSESCLNTSFDVSLEPWLIAFRYTYRLTVHLTVATIRDLPMCSSLIMSQLRQESEF